jgi:hypothetical protein
MVHHFDVAREMVREISVSKHTISSLHYYKVFQAIIFVYTFMKEEMEVGFVLFISLGVYVNDQCLVINAFIDAEKGKGVGEGDARDGGNGPESVG